MRTELKLLHGKFDTTFIYVMHEPNEAMAIADRIVVMKEGVIQQVGTPEELYFKPYNVFVAGFISKPQINFWETKITEQNGEVYINWGGTTIKLPENKAGKARAYIGKKIIAGIRPEDMFGMEVMENFDYPYPHLAIIDAEVKVREFLGDRTYLSCESENIPFSMRVLSMFDLPAQSGDKIKAGLAREKIYLFDKETEITIC